MVYIFFILSSTNEQWFSILYFLLENVSTKKFQMSFRLCNPRTTQFYNTVAKKKKGRNISVPARERERVVRDGRGPRVAWHETPRSLRTGSVVHCGARVLKTTSCVSAVLYPFPAPVHVRSTLHTHTHTRMYIYCITLARVIYLQCTVCLCVFSCVTTVRKKKLIV